MKRIGLRRVGDNGRIAVPLAHITAVEEPPEGNPIGAFVRVVGARHAFEVKETFDEIMQRIEIAEDA